MYILDDLDDREETLREIHYIFVDKIVIERGNNLSDKGVCEEFLRDFD